MKNGQLKPAYNIQCGVDAEFITWATVGPQPTDAATLIPFLEDFHAHVKERYAKVSLGFSSKRDVGCDAPTESGAFLVSLELE